jgi:acyl phosphate:glycerol-3-phosphate acyltransferase
MISIIIIIVLCYLIGSIPTSIIVGKLLKGIDIREHGSGNAGGTNVFRVLGWKPGVFVMVFDAFKGFAATFWISQIAISAISIGPELVQIIAGIAAIIGHIWTVFARFKGGKGVGTAAGMLLALYPWALLICVLVFGTVLFFTKIVSISSITAAVTLPVVLSIFRFGYDKDFALSLYVFGFFAAALIVFTHRSNIKRLLNGTENRFGKKKENKTV